MEPGIQFSTFGEKLSGLSGISELMESLGKALASGQMHMMGGGNPALIPEMQAVWRAQMERLMAGPEFDTMLGIYDGPQGSPSTLTALADLLKNEYGWQIGPENIAVTGGGQAAFFMLFNLLAGPRSDGRSPKILFPLMPEYIGYANQGWNSEMFVALPPLVEKLPGDLFKYQINYHLLDQVDDNIAAICVSRPTNPTGNVLSDTEIRRLSEFARERNIPLIVDNAYGAPFPNIVFTDITPVWDENMILTLSLSKLGLPGTRTAFVVGPESLIKRVTVMNAVLSLANNNVGQSIIRPLLEDRSILQLSREVVRPYYQQRSEQALMWVRQAFQGIPYQVHVSEGALFLWIRFPGLPITSSELAERLCARSVLIIPGHYFFFGLQEPHLHEHECIRMTFSQDPETVERGIGIMADELRKIYAHQ